MFERLIADVTAGLVDVVIVWRSDRLTRQPRDACIHRVTVVDGTGELDERNRDVLVTDVRVGWC